MINEKTSYKIAIVQTSPIFLNKNATVELACDLIKEAAKSGASIILFPEAFISGYPDWVWLLPPSKKDMINDLYREFITHAVRIPDVSIDLLCKAAKDSSIFVAIGVNERNSESSDATVYNTLLYINSDGSIAGKHRKLIPTGGERLMWGQGDGNTLISLDSPFGKLGGLICWECYMPLARQAMYQSGVQLFFAPTWDSSESWQIAMRHIAREGGMFVVGCAQCVRMSDIPDSYEFKQFYPDEREWINKGNSCVVGPDGKVIAGPFEAEQSIFYVDINLSEIPSQKWLFDVAGHYARPDVFNFEIKKNK